MTGMEQRVCRKCGFAMPETAPEMLCPPCSVSGVLEGRLFDREKDAPLIEGLRVCEELGEGGFGVVYLAVEGGKFEREVAVKVLKPGVDTRAVLRRFEVEQQALSLLKHPGIAKIYQSGKTEAGNLYFSMELIEGFPISEYLSGRELREKLEIFSRVCDAVDYAHGKGVIHRDLKPGNILVAMDGSPKVIDFGLAKAMDPGRAPGMTLYTGDGSQWGTPEYMAPEQNEVGALDVGPQADVFALGVILFELLSGRRMVLEDRTKIRKVVGGEIPGELKAVVFKSLRDDLSERYQSAGELRAELSRVLDGRKPLARWPGMMSRRSCFLLGGMAAGGVAALGFFWPGRAGGGGNASPLVVSELKGHPMNFLFNRDGSRGLVLFRNGGAAVLLDGRTGEEVARIPPAGSSIRARCFSSDGESVLLGYRDGSLRRFSAENGEPISGMESLTASRSHGVELLAHRRLGGDQEPTLIAQTGGEIMVRGWDDGGRETWRVPLPRAAWGWVVSGRHQAMVFGSGNGILMFVDLRIGNEARVLEGHGERIVGLEKLHGEEGFVTAGKDGSVICRDWQGILRARWQVNIPIREVVFCPAMGRMAVIGNSGEVRLHEITSGKSLGELHSRERVHAAVFSKDGRVIVTLSGEGLVEVWRVDDGKKLKPEWRVATGTHQVVCLFSGRIWVAASGYGVISREWEDFLGEEV